MKRILRKMQYGTVRSMQLFLGVLPWQIRSIPTRRWPDVLEGHRLFAVEDGRAILESGGQKKVLDADSVVIAVGFRPVPSMAQELQGCGAAVYEIGDGQKVSTILHAVWDGYEAGNNI